MTPSKIEREGGHTAGPWFAVPYGDGNDTVICKDEAGNKRIAFMAIPGSRDDKARRKAWTEIKANARLIAAAPELLSHLEFAVKLLRPFGHSAQVQAMEAVIAKAKTGGGTRPQPEPQEQDDRPEWEMRTGFREEDFA